MAVTVSHNLIATKRTLRRSVTKSFSKAALTAPCPVFVADCTHRLLAYLIYNRKRQLS